MLDGYGCLACAGKAPKRPADYRALAQARGFHWLGPEVLNVHTKTGWQCARGHRWQARHNQIRRGQGCPVCAGKAPKRPADYQALAQARGFRWLGPEVSNNKTRTGWQCARGHRWQARYNKIWQGQDCPVCAGKAPRGPADYRALAQARGFRWLGPEAPNILTKTGWECAQGHRWQARYGNIQQGSGCPICARKAKPGHRSTRA